MHTRTLYVCLLTQDGAILLHWNMQARPETFLQAIAPYREDMVVAVECIFTWYWLAALCAQQDIPFVLGHALSMKAMHGGTATNDKIAAQTIAVRLRGGLLPQAYVSPAAMRATRDLLRRRIYWTRHRPELLTHMQNTHSPYHLPEIGKKLASKANRAGVAERFPARAVQQSMAVALALIGDDDQRRSTGELHILTAAKPHDAQTLSLLQTVPGSGNILRLGLRYDIHDLERFPRVPAFLSSCRLITCAKDSAGKRYGPSGTNMGHAYLTRAFSAAAVLLLRDHPAGQKALRRVETKHGQGPALTVLAQQLARAV